MTGINGYFQMAQLRRSSVLAASTCRGGKLGGGEK
jgi:hypothetical protein